MAPSYVDDEMGAVMGEGVQTQRAFLLGRTLYDERSQTGPGAPTTGSARTRHGHRLLDGTPTHPLRLLSSRALTSGVLHPRYAPA